MDKPDQIETNRLIELARHIVNGLDMLGQTNMAEHIKHIGAQLEQERDYSDVLQAKLDTLCDGLDEFTYGMDAVGDSEYICALLKTARETS